jgi:hypothetical protein
VSIALFFVVSGFLLTALLGSIERSRKMLGVAAAFLVALACIIVFIKPVQLPPASVLLHGPGATSTSSTIPAHAGGAAVSASAIVDEGGPGEGTSVR